MREGGRRKKRGREVRGKRKNGKRREEGRGRRLGRWKEQGGKEGTRGKFIIVYRLDCPNSQYIPKYNSKINKNYKTSTMTGRPWEEGIGEMGRRRWEG